MNILLLEKGCQNCAYIKIALDMNKVDDETYISKTGEKILVFISPHSDGTILFTQRFGMAQVAPILKLEDGTELVKVDEIIQFVKANGYGKT